MKIKVFLLALVASVMVFSCKHDESEPNINTPQSQQTSDRLVFASATQFKQAMTIITKADDRKAAVNNVINSSLAVSKNKFQSLTEYRAAITDNNSFRVLLDSSQIDEDSLDNLVPDPAFASVLNKDLELQVGGVIYKITPFGTFICEQNKLAELYELLKNNTYSKGNEIKQSDYLYKINDGIFRYDTYGEVAAKAAINHLVPVSGNSNSRIQACNYPQPDATYPGSFLSESDYCGINSYEFGANTVVGKWIENVFGTNTDVTQNFDSKHRVKVKLYDFNYVVYSSIGLKVKFQRKGWTQIWDKKDCDRLVIGWDGIIFETPLPYSAPSNVATFPKMVIAKELMKFVNFEVEAGVISRLDDQLTGTNYWGNDDISKALKNASTNLLATILGKVWDYSERTLAPSGRDYRNNSTKAFRALYPDKVTTVISRWEKSETNDGEIDCMFDFNTIRISYKGDGTAASLWENFIKPSLDNHAESYKVVKASIYGAATFNSQWKGARIVQD